MEPDYATLFHQSSKSLQKGHRPIPKDRSQWPKQWTLVYYKDYLRFPKITLPRPTVRADLFETILTRKTARAYTAVAITLNEVATLLQYSCGITHSSHDQSHMDRAQPSAGARFPLEMYVVILRASAGLAPGLYHYHVKTHSLEVLWEKQFSADETAQWFTFDWASQASAVFFITAVFERNQMKYGERGYRYILLEAGHVGQNLSLIAQALGLKHCAIGGTFDTIIENMLDIDGHHESLLYTFVIGH